MGRERLSLEERRKRRRALDTLGVPEFEPFLREREVLGPALMTKREVDTPQLNVGLYCTQACGWQKRAA